MKMCMQLKVLILLCLGILPFTSFAFVELRYIATLMAKDMVIVSAQSRTYSELQKLEAPMNCVPLYPQPSLTFDFRSLLSKVTSIHPINISGFLEDYLFLWMLVMISFWKDAKSVSVTFIGSYWHCC